MSDYVQALRSKDETPGSLPAMTKEAESAILDKYKDEVIAAQEGEQRHYWPNKLEAKIRLVCRKKLQTGGKVLNFILCLSERADPRGE